MARGSSIGSDIDTVLRCESPALETPEDPEGWFPAQPFRPSPGRPWLLRISPEKAGLKVTETTATEERQQKHGVTGKVSSPVGVSEEARLGLAGANICGT